MVKICFFSNIQSKVNCTPELEELIIKKALNPVNSQLGTNSDQLLSPPSLNNTYDNRATSLGLHRQISRGVG